ncbi:MAG: TetR/AcrR family transcriptional regulator, partial [Kribbellaceae bacterium]|nr:TetR/AcrR family transcriptional regulator [Kribbellaceae bacterium]
ELLQHIEEAIADAMERTGVADPRLTAALVVAAYRVVHLEAVRRVLAGDDAVVVAVVVAADHRARIVSALERVDQLCR